VTSEARMKDDARPQFGFPVAPWHLWFAWRPVRTFDGRWVWLRTVRRRLIQKHDYLPQGGPDSWWQFRYDGGYSP
jgi:hypothetical protein